MKTRERILHTSLELFNTYGEPNVTTLMISDEMDISPGNLYYHYHNKAEIVYEIFSWFEAEMNDLLDIPEDIEVSLEDQWFFLHLIFEIISRYRFIYRDLVNVLTRYEKLGRRFNRIIDDKIQATTRICQNLVKQGTMVASNEAIASVSESIAITTTYWFSYQQVRSKPKTQVEVDFNRGVYQVLSLLVPYLGAQDQNLLEMVSQSYIAA